MDLKPVPLPGPPHPRISGVQYLQDFETHVQTIACWVADHFARTALWPSQPAMWREMIKREISPNDVMRDGSFAFENFTNAPRDGKFVGLRCWALFDSGRCREAFTAAYAVYLDLEKQLQDKDSVRVTHEDIARLSGIDLNGDDLHRVLWVLHQTWGGAWDYMTTRNEWALDFGVGMTTFPRPTIERLFLSRLTGAAPKALVSAIRGDNSLILNIGSGVEDAPDVETGEKFSIDRKLGEGVYADVWLAQDTDLDREVALKIVRPDAPGAQNALTHARALARVQHPNIVTVYQVVDGVRDPMTRRPASAVIMEYVCGPSLEDVLRGPPLEIPRARDIGLGLVAAVTAYHERGLAHTDLHDGNIVVSGDLVKVLDPLYFETALMQSTASRDSFQARDGRNLRDLLSRLLRKANVSAQALVGFATLSEHAPRSLESAFASALDSAVPAPAARAALPNNPSAHTEIDATIGFKRLDHSTGDIHHYDLDVCVKNVGRRRLDDWEVDLEFPTPLMEPHVTIVAKVADQSDGKRTLLRHQGPQMQKALRPGEEHHLHLGYFVDDEIYHGRKRGRSHYFDELVRVRVLVDGSIAAELEKAVRDLQEF